VPSPWRRHIAQTLHEMLLRDRPEQRATLTVLPDALPAQRAYAKWGWRIVTQKRNPLPGSPVFDVLLKDLNPLNDRPQRRPGSRDAHRSGRHDRRERFT
jgi:hypothetical protein